MASPPRSRASLRPEEPPRSPREASPSNPPPTTPRATAQPSPGRGRRSPSLPPSGPPSSSDREPLPPPPPPRPWTWRCHHCDALLRLACTRRCLRCGHRLCTRPGRRKGKTCRMEFDYQRWRAWGAWREGAGPAVSEGRRGRPRRDCWQECQYPSECHHLRAMRRGRGDAGSGFRATAVDEQPVSPPSSPPSLSPLLRSAVTCPDVEVGDGRSVSAADGCLDHDGCFMAAMNEGPGLEPGRTFDPVMLEGSLMSVVAGRLRRDGGWRSDDECPSCDEVEDVKMGDGKPMV